jgi:hypothetical protein
MKASLFKAVSVAVLLSLLIVPAAFARAGRTPRAL